MPETMNILPASYTLHREGRKTSSPWAVPFTEKSPAARIRLQTVVSSGDLPNHHVPKGLERTSRSRPASWKNAPLLTGVNSRV